VEGLTVRFPEDCDVDWDMMDVEQISFRDIFETTSVRIGIYMISKNVRKKKESISQLLDILTSNFRPPKEPLADPLVAAELIS
jgi:hypothetical protein